MYIKIIRFFKLDNVFDLSESGIDDLKISSSILGCIIAFIFIFIFPWLYGLFKIFGG